MPSFARVFPQPQLCFRQHVLTTQLKRSTSRKEAASRQTAQTQTRSAASDEAVTNLCSLSNVRTATTSVKHASELPLQAANELHLFVALTSQIHLLECTKPRGQAPPQCKQYAFAILVAVVDSFLKASTLRSSSLASRR